MVNGCDYGPEDLLAHRAPMLLLDEILRYDRQSLCAAVKVCPGKPFCDEQGAPGWIGLEWMAQTAGAWAGARQLDAGQRVAIGFLLGTRRYQGPARFGLGRWYANVRRTLFDESAGIAVMDAALSKSRDGDAPTATSRIKLFQPPDVDGFVASQGIMDV